MATKDYYKVTLAHAVSDEEGHGTGGKAGDQTGNEVKFQDWYNRTKKWHTVLRASQAIRRKIKTNAIAGVRNVHLGYDMNQRYTAYDKLKNKGYDYNKLTEDTECDCSQFATTCSSYAGVPVPRDTTTANMVARYLATKQYKALTGDKYAETSENLKAGDIIVGEGHTAIVANVYWRMNKNLRRGATGRKADIKALQQRLNDKYGSKLVVDGDFGVKTENSVIGFQLENGLEPDGIVGRKTAEALDFLWG